MEEIYITEEELEYLTDVPDIAREDAGTYGYKRQMSFEEAVKACNGITLEEFSKMWEESINRLIPN